MSTDSLGLSTIELTGVGADTLPDQFQPVCTQSHEGGLTRNRLRPDPERPRIYVGLVSDPLHAPVGQ